jgi:hypothetical protein
MRVKRTLAVLAVATGVLMAAGCTKEADDVNKNLATDADNFKVARTVTFLNGITDKEMLRITGYCSVDMSDPARYGVTCKTDGGKYVKHLLGKSDNVTVVVEQNEATDTSASHYRFVLRPGALVPDVDVEPTK